MDRILTPSFQHPFIVLVFVSSVQFCPVCKCQQTGGEPRERRKPESGSGGGGDTEPRTCNHPFFPTMLVVCANQPTVKTVSCPYELGDADI